MSNLRTPRLPLLPDPLRRIRLPRDLDAITSVAAEQDPTDVGMTRDGVESMWRAAKSLYQAGVHPAIQICVRRNGAVVLDRAIGHARGNGPQDSADTPKELVTTETPLGIFSASKGVTATLVHLLDERGVIHVGDPVAEYLPRFAENGKAGITIGHLLSHRAGIPNVTEEGFDLDVVADWERQREMMYAAKPVFRPGKRQAYHAVSGGNILGEVIREATGKDIRQVMSEEILDPLDFRWTNFGVAPEDLPKVGLNYPTGAILVPPLSTIITRALGGVHPDRATEMSNDPRFYGAAMPAANVVSTANELSRFYEVLRRGGELDGVRIMEERTLNRARVPQSHMEVDLNLGLPIAFSMGYMLGGRILSLYGPDTTQAFGHLGWINILSWADPQRGISAAMITTGKCVVFPEMARFPKVAMAVTKAAPKLSRS